MECNLPTSKNTESNTYHTNRYLSRERWMSYWTQIHEALRLEVRDILEVGPGNNIVSSVLGEMGCLVKTFDNDPLNHPDFLGDILVDMKKITGEYELVLACQVLEHIPYSHFTETLRYFYQISRKYLIISLPYTNRGSLKFYLSFMFLPFLRKISYIKIMTLFPCKWKFNGEHYWEIGVKNCSLKRILNDISNTGWKILRHYPVKENPYHYFIICEKKS